MMHKNAICRVIFPILIPCVLIPFVACTTAPDYHATQVKITEKADSIYNDIVEIRRDIHQHPELSGSESRTAALVAEQLTSFGMEVRTNVGGHGVVGIVHGTSPGPVVAYRADMDAIPQELQEDVPFRSATRGMSHGCGHDVHTAVGLGVARVLSSMKDELPGTVVFYFQPAEENVEGAWKMIEDGVMNDPVPEAIFAIHVGPFEVGTMVTNPGVGLPGIERFAITLRGPARLDEAATALVDSIRAIGTVGYPESPDQWKGSFDFPLMQDGPYSSFVLAMAWTEKTSVPNERTVRGFFKASGEMEYIRARAATERAVKALEAMDVRGEIQSKKVLPDMFCDEDLTLWAANPLSSMLGQSSVLRAYTSIPFFGEDFAYFLERIPGTMFFLGGSNMEQGIVALPHSPAFSVDEEAIRVGIKGMSNVVARYLVNPPPRPGE